METQAPDPQVDPPSPHAHGCLQIYNGEQVLSICKQIIEAPEVYLDEIQD